MDELTRYSYGVGSLTRQLRSEPQLIPGSDWLSARGGYLFAPVEELREATPEERQIARHPAWTTHKDLTGRDRKTRFLEAGRCAECGADKVGADVEYRRCAGCRSSQRARWRARREGNCRDCGCERVGDDRSYARCRPCRIKAAAWQAWQRAHRVAEREAGVRA